MLKKSLAILCCILLLTASSALARELTIEEFMEANATANLLKRHSSVALLQTINGHESAVWVNRDVRYTANRQDQSIREGDSETLMTKDHCLMLMYMQFAEGVYPVPFILLDSGLGESRYYDLEAGYNADLLFDTEVTAKEKVQKVEEKDGVLTLTTWLTGEDFTDAWGEGYQAGSYCELVYTLDSETLELRSDVETVLDADGRPLSEGLYYQLFSTDNLQSAQQALYDTEMPQDVKEMVGFLAAFLDATGADARTVTYVLYPGTMHEKEISVTGAKGYGVALSTGEYEYELYLDEAMTVKAPSDDLNSDRRVYVKLNAPDMKDDV